MTPKEISGGGGGCAQDGSDSKQRDRFDGGMPTPAHIFHGEADEDRWVVYHFDETGSFMLASLRNEQMIRDEVASLGQDITTLRREEIDGNVLSVDGLIAASKKRTNNERQE